MDAILLLTNLPDEERALALAGKLIDSNLAACVNILSPCKSVYRWEGKLETASEVPLLIKTMHSRYGEVESFIKANHPYELPEIIAVPVTGGLPEYLNWIAAETALKK